MQRHRTPYSLLRVLSASSTSLGNCFCRVADAATDSPPTPSCSASGGDTWISPVFTPNTKFVVRTQNKYGGRSCQTRKVYVSTVMSTPVPHLQEPKAALRSSRVSRLGAASRSFSPLPSAFSAVPAETASSTHNRMSRREREEPMPNPKPTLNPKP